jgi:RimJ/RimL family protein N-acetyltransferase
VAIAVLHPRSGRRGDYFWILFAVLLGSGLWLTMFVMDNGRLEPAEVYTPLCEGGTPTPQLLYALFMNQLRDATLTIADSVLLLRYWSEDDLLAIVQAMQDPEIVRWIQHIPVPYGGANGRQFLELVESEREAGRAVHLAVEDVVSNEIVGGIALTHIDCTEGTAEIGYWVSRTRRRQGIATRATQLMAGWAFNDLRLERLSLFTDPDNTPSQRVAERSGFQREGILRGHTPMRSGGRRDSVIFGLLAIDEESRERAR